jgi:hypothetical protein
LPNHAQTISVPEASVPNVPEASQPQRMPVDAKTLVLCCLIFLALCARSFVLQYRVTHQLTFVDDAYYYIVLARHLVQTGKSTFDGLALTNGYHPLWMLLLAAQYKLFGDSFLLTRAIEYLLGLGTLIAALRVVRLPGMALNLVFSAGLYELLAHFAFNGMETTLFAFCFTAFTWYSQCRKPSSGNSSSPNGIGLGLFAAAAVASRIDAAVFILPQLLLFSGPRARRLVACATLLLCGLAYAALNHHIFGVTMPISGEIKSLGGLQLNHRLLQVLAAPSQPVAALFYVAAGMFLLTPFAIARTTNLTLRGVQYAYMIGFVLYLARMLFFSSWRIWIWYDYPVLIGYIGCSPTVLLLLHHRLQRLFTQPQLTLATAILAVCAVLFSARDLLTPTRPEPLGYFYLNHLLIDRYANTLNGTPVAMGDRAGNFAYEYPGGVDQLEGLMNDHAFFNTLRTHGDVKALLCQRHIAFVASYEPDLSNYTTHSVATIRFALSQFPAPTLLVSRADEIGHVSNPAQFSQQTFGDPNVYLYLWKLHCPVPTDEAKLAQ